MKYVRETVGFSDTTKYRNWKGKDFKIFLVTVNQVQTVQNLIPRVQTASSSQNLIGITYYITSIFSRKPPIRWTKKENPLASC